MHDGRPIVPRIAHYEIEAQPGLLELEKSTSLSRSNQLNQVKKLSDHTCDISKQLASPRVRQKHPTSDSQKLQSGEIRTINKLQPAFKELSGFA